MYERWRIIDHVKTKSTEYENETENEIIEMAQEWQNEQLKIIWKNGKNTTKEKKKWKTSVQERTTWPRPIVKQKMEIFNNSENSVVNENFDGNRSTGTGTETRLQRNWN